MGEFETVMQTRDEGGQTWTCQRPGPTIKMKNARQNAREGRGAGWGEWTLLELLEPLT